MNLKNVWKELKDKIKECKEKLFLYIKKLKKEQKILIVLGVFLSLLSFFTNNNSIFESKYQIARPTFGENDAYYNLIVKGLDTKDEEKRILVSKMRYTKEEAEKIFDSLYDTTLEKALNGNEDFLNIKSDLNLFREYRDKGINLIWTFEPYREGETNNAEYYMEYQKLISSDGKVDNQTLPLGVIVEGYLKLKFSTKILDSDKKYERNEYESKNYLIPIKIFPKEIEYNEKIKKLFDEELLIIDKSTTNKKNFILPTSIKDVKISYDEKKDYSSIIIFIFFIIIAIMFGYKDKIKEKEEKKNRERTLLLDYPNIVSKLLIYVACGMTIRNAFIKISNNYEMNVSNNVAKSTFAYEEIKSMSKKLSSGVIENACYNDFVQHIDLKVYTRFMNILEQNIKNGGRSLIQTLKLEVMEAFEERKLNAKKLGEEASTKLIFPLMIMLGIVMVIVMVPALMSF
ncbi:MAG: type II secretion system F family protein [Eubacteriales bacterium]|nr:type II secretion system F family protein [Eubacteriales bacterium]